MQLHILQEMMEFLLTSAISITLVHPIDDISIVSWYF